MHTVMWTFQVPEGTSKDDLRQTIKTTAHTYEGIHGLIRKYALNMCRQCFREYANDIGFKKLD